MNNFNEIINSLDFELDELKQVKKNILTIILIFIV